MTDVFMDSWCLKALLDARLSMARHVSLCLLYSRPSPYRNPPLLPITFARLNSHCVVKFGNYKTPPRLLLPDGKLLQLGSILWLLPPKYYIQLASTTKHRVAPPLTLIHLLHLQSSPYSPFLTSYTQNKNTHFR
ncbi:hypothetical protein ACTXT7_001111 [Hymenolepis weldensis]